MPLNETARWLHDAVPAESINRLTAGCGVSPVIAELLFRIGEAELKIPPLREIRSAIPNLVGDILGKLQGVSRYDGTSTV